MFLNFLAISLISILAITTTWLITYEILRIVWNILPKLTAHPRMRVMLIGIPIFLVHIINIWFYACIYFLVENYTSLGRIVGEHRVYGIHFESFLDCLHFSTATYSSLGLGDLVPVHDIRMIVGAEVLNGLVIIGWTISFTYLTMEKFWQLHKEKK